MAVIITGDNSRHTDKALEWLKANGAKFEESLGLQIITLPDTMELWHDNNRSWRYTVAISADNGDGQYIEIESHADPYEVGMYLEGEPIEDVDEPDDSPEISNLIDSIKA